MEVGVVIVVALLVGLVIGLLSGLLGIGGGTLMIPVFKLAFGMSAIASTATSLFVIVPTSISGAVSHLRNGTCIPLLGLSAGIGGAVMSPLGVWLASISPEWMIMIFAVAVIAYSAITMFMKANALRKRDAAIDDESQAERHESTDLSAFMLHVQKPRLVGFGIAIGLGAGLLSGYVGVGGGFIMVPLFMQLLGTPMKLTSGTSLIAVMILAIPGTVTQALMGNVVWSAGICMALGCIPGAFIGSRLIKRIPEVALRYAFSCFLLVAALMLAANQLNLI